MRMNAGPVRRNRARVVCSAGLVPIGVHDPQQRRYPHRQAPRRRRRRAPFPDDRFDLVVSTYSSHHWADPEAAATGGPDVDYESDTATAIVRLRRPPVRLVMVAGTAVFIR